MYTQPPQSILTIKDTAMHKRFSLPLFCVVFFSTHSHSYEIDYKKFSQLFHEYVQSDHTNHLIPVLIIGGGPAGLSAALQTARAQLKTVIFTKEIGGHLSKANLVENWPGKARTSGGAIMEELALQARSFGTEITTEIVSNIDTSKWPYTVTTKSGKVLQALTIIIATGGNEIFPNIPDIQKYFGKGIGICPICDAPFDKGKTVAVFGNNDFAADKALRSAQFAKKVILFIEDEHPKITTKVLEYIKERDNISIQSNTQLLQLIGNNDKLAAIEIYHPKNKTTETIPVQRVYFALGFTPNSNICPNLIVDTDGYIQLYNQTHQTSIPGIFAAGTVEDKIYQKAANVIGRGVQAGLDAINFLQQIVINDYELWLPSRYFKSIADASIELISSQEQLNENLKQHDIIVLDFFISSCPDCKQLMPLLEQLAQEYENKIKFLKIDYEQTPEIVEAFEIEEVPTLLLIKKGTIIDRTETLINTKSEVEQFILKALE